MIRPRSLPVIPPRTAWATDVVGACAGDAVLELGCGHGVAAALVACQVGPSGHVVAVDRSARAVARARRVGQALIDQGRLEVRQASIAHLDGLRPDFDRVFAVNVNLFWARGCDDAVRLVADFVGPGGRLDVVYDLPDPTCTPAIARLVAARLEHCGLRPTALAGPSPALVAISGERMS